VFRSRTSSFGRFCSVVEPKNTEVGRRGRGPILNCPDSANFWQVFALPQRVKSYSSAAFEILAPSAAWGEPVGGVRSALVSRQRSAHSAVIHCREPEPMPRKKPGLILAAQRTAKARQIIAAQHALIVKLKTSGKSTLDAERSLSTYVSSLKHLEDCGREVKQSDKVKTAATKKRKLK